MAENLEGLEAERKATVAAIAHELRTPLTVLRGRLEAVRDGVLEGSPEEFGVLISQVELLSRLVTDLRTLSLAEAGQLSLERQEVDLAVLVRSVASSFATRAGEKGVRLEVNADVSARLTVDAERVHQVIGNLLENALRHTSEGFVRVSLEATTVGAKVRVRDSGTGIPEDALPHIFERFYRADSSRARVSGGSGLGLAIVRAIVQSHGGSIGARNHADGGAEFTLTLPRAGRLEPQKLPLKAQNKFAPILEPKLRAAKRQTVENDGFIAPGSFTVALYHAVSFPLGLLYFVSLVIGVALGAGTAIIGVGFVVLSVTLAFIAYAANLERWLNDALLGVPVRYAPPSRRGGFWARFGSSLRDPMTWRALFYLLLKMPFALFSSALLLAFGGSSLVLIAAPIIRAITNGPDIVAFDWQIDTVTEGFIAAGIGFVLLWLTFVLSNALAWLWARLARLLLEDTPPHAAPRKLEA